VQNVVLRFIRLIFFSSFSLLMPGDSSSEGFARRFPGRFLLPPRARSHCLCQGICPPPPPTLSHRRATPFYKIFFDLCRRAGSFFFFCPVAPFFLDAAQEQRRGGAPRGECDSRTLRIFFLQKCSTVSMFLFPFVPEALRTDDFF